MDLFSVRDFKNRIRSFELRLDNLREALTSTTTRFDGMPRAKSLNSRIETLTQRIIDAEAELVDLRNAQADAALSLALEIYQRVDNQASAQILIMRYIDCLPFKDIISELSYSEARIYSLHRNGVAEFNSKETNNDSD